MNIYVVLIGETCEPGKIQLVTTNKDQAIQYAKDLYEDPADVGIHCQAWVNGQSKTCVELSC